MERDGGEYNPEISSLEKTENSLKICIFLSLPSHFPDYEQVSIRDQNAPIAIFPWLWEKNAGKGEVGNDRFHCRSHLSQQQYYKVSK